MQRKGIILAGGTGTRLYPVTQAVSKQLLPVFDKPMIYYPLSTLMLANIREILIITTPRDLPSFQALLGDGTSWGLNFTYAIQNQPEGLAQALLIGEHFLNGSPSAVILGDNIFYGHALPGLLRETSMQQHGASIFIYRVRDPENYGVAEFDKSGKVVSLKEKPTTPKSKFAVTGLYFYDALAVDFAKELRPSIRGELEITDLNQNYLDRGMLDARAMGRGYAWLDTGTHETLLEAHQLIQTIENRQGMKISCPEEIAYRNKWISRSQLRDLAKSMHHSSYGNYLMQLIQDE